MVKANVFIYNNAFEGFPKESDLKLIQEDLPPLKDGEFLAEAVYLSVDPYMRGYAPALKVGTTFIGGQIAIIRESKNPKFPVGKYCFGQFGWRSHTISNGNPDSSQKISLFNYILPDFKGLSPSLGLGVLGMPGNTAYFGLLDICNPKPDETVVVTGAAGAVGSHVGQIAKIKNCKVIGIAGSDEKGKWLVDELKFDHFINYKTDNVKKSLRQIAPQGVDCYFDNDSTISGKLVGGYSRCHKQISKLIKNTTELLNLYKQKQTCNLYSKSRGKSVTEVGGEVSSIIINQMNRFGRISVCGAISAYNERAPKASVVQGSFALKQLKMEGFIVDRWLNRWTEGIDQNIKWIQEGKVKYRETYTDGFENMFQAFTDMLKGVNYGKAIVRIKTLVK